MTVPPCQRLCFSVRLERRFSVPACTLIECQSRRPSREARSRAEPRTAASLRRAWRARRALDLDGRCPRRNAWAGWASECTRTHDRQPNSTNRGRSLALSKIARCMVECENTTPFRLFLCLSCRVQVVICRRCDRGQSYCSANCALEARRCKQREARRRYQTSDRGRQMHVQRSRRYRARNSSVTDQGPKNTGFDDSADHPTNSITAVSPPRAAVVAARPLTTCCRCARQGSGFVFLDSSVPSRRRLDRGRSIPASVSRRRRQKITDLHRH